jgi:hypothetical protein
LPLNNVLAIAALTLVLAQALASSNWTLTLRLGGVCGEKLSTAAVRECLARANPVEKRIDSSGEKPRSASGSTQHGAARERRRVNHVSPCHPSCVTIFTSSLEAGDRVETPETLGEFFPLHNSAEQNCT